MSRSHAPLPRRAGSARGACLLAAFLALVLSACSMISIARTVETTYLLDGRTYVLQEFSFKDQHNFTLLEVVGGERSFVALYEPGTSGTDVFEDPIPEGEGHLTTIMTVVQKGEQQGEAQTSSQRSVVLDVEGD